MASVNKVILIGNLGNDPETRYLPSGDAVTNISIATSEKWKDKSGEQQEHTEWHRITFFGKLAEIANEYLRKGAAVYVEGRIRTNKYTDKEGVERYSTQIIADRMQMLGKREGGQQEQRSARQEPAPPKQAAARQGGGVQKAGGFDTMEDDIPFAPIARGICGHVV